jgi:drug/metabolite transporter (DMT)-like permease
MAVLLGLLVAAFFGFGDFCGGMASKQMSSLRVLVRSQPFALAASLVVALAVGGHPTTADIVRALLVGVASVGGLGLLYRGLAIGPMGVVAPLTAAGSAVIPVAWGLIKGEELTLVTGTGVAVILMAIVLLARSGDTSKTSTVHASSIVLALAAGACFGTGVILLASTSKHGGVWPAMFERISLFAVALLLARATNQPKISINRRTAVFIAGNIIGDVTATVLLIVATRRGLLAIVAPLQALYLAVTVLLARVLLHERLRHIQRVGMVLALGGIIALAV